MSIPGSGPPIALCPLDFHLFDCVRCAPCLCRSLFSPFAYFTAPLSSASTRQLVYPEPALPPPRSLKAAWWCAGRLIVFLQKSPLVSQDGDPPPEFPFRSPLAAVGCLTSFPQELMASILLRDRRVFFTYTDLFGRVRIRFRKDHQMRR